MPYDSTPSSFIHPDVLRGHFCSALSAMYRKEVPLYGDLVELVDEVNAEVRSRGGSWEVAQRLSVERHGAIRLGKPSELAFIARLFRCMGMHPVGYYDLSTAGVPVHATAFRPITPSALAANPFRVFTSLLRPELIVDERLRAEALEILDKRDIFHPTVRALVAKAEEEGGLEEADADKLVKFGLETFRWHEHALVDETTYLKLKKTHPLLADITGFQGPHINHLTPRVLDIDAAQHGMAKRGIPPKQIIEGPPQRECPILLRQTSFQALSEPIKFPGGQVDGSHRARFGEIESRGVALTRKGHNLYLALQDENRRTAGASTPTDDNDKHQAHLSRTFASFPDSWTELRRQALAYFQYSLAFHAVTPRSTKTLEQLIADGMVTITPLVYEDFLPASAAGIFQSNLGEHESTTKEGPPSQAEFEQSLGSKVHDYFDMYAKMQQDSIEEVVRLTGCKVEPKQEA